MHTHSINHTKLFILFSVLLLLASCEHKDNSILKLTSPSSDTAKEYCCIDFEWESNSILNDHNFMLAADMKFDSILIDSSGLGTELSTSLHFATGTTYYWKVESESLDLETTSSFDVIDYVDKYEGVYNAIFSEKVWIINIGQEPEFTVDTTYQGDVTLLKSKTNGYLQLSYLQEAEFKKNDFKLDEIPNSFGSLYFWDNLETDPNIQNQGSLYLMQDSLSFSSRQVINDGGSVFYISAKLK